MSRIVHFLCIASFLAAFSTTAGGETMAERKQRIMRKYLRERQDAELLDMVVPEPGEEEELLAESSRFQDPASELARQENRGPRRPPAPRPARPQAEQNAWWSDYLEAGNDPYADPFAEESGEAAANKRDALWENWYRLQEERNAAASESDSPDGFRYDDYSRDRTDNRSIFGVEQRSGYSPRRTESEREYGRRDLFGRDERRGLFGDRNDESSPSGLLQTPFTSQRDSRATQPQTSEEPRVRSRRQLPDRRRSETQPTPSATETQPRRETPYEQWKERNRSRTWDPTADDAYVDELMQRDRR